MIGRALLLAAILLAAAAAHAEERLRLYAAGSLTEAMTAMLAESGLQQDGVAPPVFGPSGVLRETPCVNVLGYWSVACRHVRPQGRFAPAKAPVAFGAP